MIVKHNLTAMNNRRFLGIVTDREEKRSEKLSSGYRINRAADDAAGLAISEKMRRQIRGLTQASANAQDGISLLQSAEGALHEVHEMLQRMNELAIQSANGTNAQEDRNYLQEEVAQIITEVDRVANTTKFNDVNLLDGSCARKESQVVFGGGTTFPSIIAGNVVVYNAVSTIQKRDPFYAAATDFSEIRTMLENQIVPQAVEALLNTFSETFGYLNGSDIGIGLYIYDDDSDATVAYVQTKYDYHRGYNPPKVWMHYQLGVNMGMIGKDAVTGQITEAGRKYLESTIVHEMMHGMMFEALSSGMLGVDVNIVMQKGFPDWFVEGTAQVAGGGIGWVRSGLRINEYSDDAAIQSALSTHYLGKGNNFASNYGTGYLAVMYLGHLISGGTSMQATDIARGVDILLNEIRGGKSLDKAIADNTNYTGLANFEANFAADGVAFTKQLLQDSAISFTDYGSGALVTGNFRETDLLQDVDTAENVFNLDTGFLWVENEYPDDYPVMSGGMATLTGVEGPDYVPSATTGGAGSGGGTSGNTGGTGTAPGGNTGGGTGTNPGGNTGGGAGTNPGGMTTGTTVNYGGGLSLNVGAEAGQRITIFIEAMNAAKLGIAQVDISTRDGATAAIDVVKEAISTLSAQRAELGAYQNRLEYTVRNLDNVVENTQAAQSRIRDADMAKEMVELSNLRILRQAGQAMLAQNKRYNQGVFTLLSS